MFERYYSCSIIAYCRYVMFQKRILSKPKWGGARPPWPPRSDGTGTWSTGTNQICPFVAVLSFENQKKYLKN